MDIDQIQKLIELVNDSNISELKIEKADFKINIKTKHYSKMVAPVPSPQQLVVPMQQPVAAAPINHAPPPVNHTAPPTQDTTTPSTTPTPEATPSGVNQQQIKSPMIGTFYRCSGPDKPPYIKIGDSIAKGDVVCIIEAMKLFNEIEADVSGKIVKILVEDNSPVEYDQPLFIVE